MGQHNLGRNIRLTKVSEDGASAGTAVNTSSVDMQDWTGCIFFGTIDTANAANFANLAQSADDSSFADLAGTKVLSGDNDDVFFIDLLRPSDRYVRCELDRGGANTAHGEIYCIQYGPMRKGPASHGSDVNAEYHASPAEGTA